MTMVVRCPGLVGGVVSATVTAPAGAAAGVAAAEKTSAGRAMGWPETGLAVRAGAGATAGVAAGAGANAGAGATGRAGTVPVGAAASCMVSAVPGGTASGLAVAMLGMGGTGAIWMSAQFLRTAWKEAPTPVSPTCPISEKDWRHPRS